MKRDLDLTRRLLLDIESHGANCAVSVLSDNTTDPAEERVRYHLRLLIDGQLVKEIDRTAAGTPCVRLTNAGHELLELARSDARWREARRCAQDAAGGDSLTVVRAVLTKWAVESAVQQARTAHPRVRPVYHCPDRPAPYSRYFLENEPLLGEPRREFVPSRPDYRARVAERFARERFDREHFDWQDAYDRGVYYARYTDIAEPEYRYDRDEAAVGVSLPVGVV